MKSIMNLRVTKNCPVGKGNSFSICFVLALFFSIIVSMPSLHAQTTKSKKSLQRMYNSYLTENGYNPRVDSDGDILFTYEGRSYYIFVNENDAEFFRLVLPNIWSIESESERRKVLAAVDEASRKTKVAKAYTMNDNVWISVEAYIPEPENFQHTFRRSLRAMDSARQTFTEYMRSN
jgi:hypothetical protein